MFLSPARSSWMLSLVLLITTPLRAEDKASSRAEAEKRVHAILAKFDKGDVDWKVRMEALVSLAKIGPAAVPVLVEALKRESAETREFAAQGLVLFADSSTRPALERALADAKPGVRLYAIQALSMLGPLPRNEQNERILANDPTFFGVRPMMAAALERTDRPNQAEMRKALAEYDLRNMDSARIGEVAPDFALTDFTGKPYRLSQFRGKKTVILRFILFDY